MLKENKNDKKGKCTKIPILYDETFKKYISYFYDYLIESYYSEIKRRTVDYNDNFFCYYDYYNYPCQESINLGTRENPIYSCEKCYSLFEFEKTYQNEDFTKIINYRNNVSICFKKYYKIRLENCLEAKSINKDDIEKYDCTKCKNNFILIYDEKENLHYCQYKYTDNLKSNICRSK